MLRACRKTSKYLALRTYATVESPVIVAKPPPAPSASPRAALDDSLLSELSKTSSTTTTLPSLIQQYLQRSSHVLETPLPYESRPEAGRRITFDSDLNDAAVMIAHCVQHESTHNITLCSGFALEVSGDLERQSVVLGCAHTLEEIRRSPLLISDHLSASLNPSSSVPLKSGSFIVSHLPSPGKLATFHPVSAVLSSLHRSDLVLFSTQKDVRLKTLPVSPYPAHPDTPVRAHFIADTPPDEDGWTPWVGGTWSKWVKGTVLGYRDFAGREAKPGTYDALSHMLFKPPPTAGSSGGPIVDEESGAVVGVMLGTRMDNQIEGVRGWGVPSEAIFEMFKLPGLDLVM
ncbi:hypothetical protein JAAARDRAFT_393688 [Jaapia argillacea MUCL 33604]|uniref:Uncharacterized protein n=1 Tax=Jaapia argillacea MUCL 33604 TaxID=933084 RepID=A0A067Q9X0_9AGAM|nr:hypothetical protein JAAARDRAFT_393688 [Jaapia argillacea MUCL 33604]